MTTLTRDHIRNEKLHLIFTLALHQVIKKRTWPNDDVTSKGVEINTIIFLDIIPIVSLKRFHYNWTTVSRVIYVQISISKQYQMMMSSVAWVKFIKTNVIFRYNTKGISNQVSSNSNHEIKSYSCSNCSTKMRKNENVGKNLLGYKMGQ